MAKALDFYFFIGSTYSYLSVFRAESLCAQRGIALNWKPFSVRTIMIEQNNRPFADKPIKTRYMWRDIERRAVKFGAPFCGAPMYPIDQEELANLVATVAATEGWCADFVRAAYEAWFVGKRDPGAPSELSAMLERLGKDSVATIATAKHADTLQCYKKVTDQARALGIFGSPTFVSGTEIFWGDDRLEDALDWIEQGED